MSTEQTTALPGNLIESLRSLRNGWETPAFVIDAAESAAAEIERLRMWLRYIETDASRGGQSATYALSGAAVPLWIAKRLDRQQTTVWVRD